MIKTIATIIGTGALVLTVAISLLMPLSWVKSQVNAETYYIKVTLGEESFKTYEEDLYQIYNFVVFESGIYKGVSKLFESVPFERIKEIGKNVEYLTFQVIQRVLLIKYWTPFFFVLMVVLVIDGMGIRKIKKYSYGIADPAVFHLSLHMISLASAGLVLYLGMPFTLTNSVWIPFAIFSFIAFWLHKLISNYQKG